MRTDMAKLIVAFRRFAKEPKNDLFVFIFLCNCERVKHFRSIFVSDVIRYDCMFKYIFVLSISCSSKWGCIELLQCCGPRSLTKMVIRPLPLRRQNDFLLCREFHGGWALN